MVLLSNVHEEGRCDTVIRVFSKMVAGVPGPLDSMNNPVVTRIPKTCIFESFPDIGESGSRCVVKRVPETNAAWNLTGFSVHPEYGLGFVRMPEKIRVSKEITLTMSLPHSLKLGETAQISGVIFNNSNQSLDLKVSLESPFRRFEFVDN
jgi:CD109 antigen